MKPRKTNRRLFLACLLAAACLMCLIPGPASASRVVAGDSHGNIMVWEFPQGTEVIKLAKVHPRAIKALAYDCRNALVFTGSKDGSIAVCKLEGKDPQCKQQGHRTAVRALALAPPGHKEFAFATASKDHSIKLWKVQGEDLKLCKEFSGHQSAIYTMAFSPDGKHLVSGGAGTNLRLWDVDKCELKDKVKGHYNAINTLVYSPDGKQVATCSNDKTVKLWNASNLEEVKELKGHTAAVYAVAFSPDGKQLASGGGDRGILVWDVATGKELKKIPYPDSVSVNAIAFSKDGKSLFTGDDSGQVIMWDIATGKKVKSVKAGGAVYSLSLCK